VKVGEISITPAAGFKTLGEVAMLNGSVVVSAKEGALQVEDHGATKNVAKGQTIVLTPKTAQAKGGGASWGGGGGALGYATLGAAGLSAVLAGVAISRAGSANTNASAAIAAANGATSAANAATSEATAANSQATAAASASAAAQLLAECTYDLQDTQSWSSPYVLTAFQCATVAGNPGVRTGTSK
jgi:hypothetical protein